MLVVEVTSLGKSAVQVEGLTPTLSRIEVMTLSKPVLLVDDTYRLGRTMTVTAAWLHDAGASAVLPLVV